MASDNLNIPAVSTSQTQKEATINDGINALDKAMNGVLPITITTHRTLTATEFTRNVMFNLSGSPAADFNLVVPETNRLFAVRNQTAKVCTVKYAASGSLTLAAGVSALVHSDGTDLVSLGGGGGGGGGASTLLDLTDGPGSYAGAASYLVVVNGAGTGFEFIPNAGGGGADLIARAGATRFVVLGTFNDPADAGSSVSRNVLVTDTDGRGCARGSDVISGMDATSAYTTYCEVNVTTLPSATKDLMRLEGGSSGSAYTYLQYTSTGALTLPRDGDFTDIATSSAGVIQAGVHHKVVVSTDATNVGDVLKVWVDGVAVISTTVTGTRDTSTEFTPGDLFYQVGQSGTSTTGDDTWFSRFAVWSVALDDTDSEALSTNGVPTAYQSGQLRAYWPLEQTSGTTAIADIGGFDLTLANNAAWGSDTVFEPAEIGQTVRVGSSGTSTFSGHNNQIAIMLSTGWEFPGNVKGWECYDQSDSTTTVWSGSAWA